LGIKIYLRGQKLGVQAIDARPNWNSRRAPKIFNLLLLEVFKKFGK